MKLVLTCFILTFILTCWSQLAIGQIPAYTEFKDRIGTVITERTIRVDTLGLRCYGGNYRDNDTFVACKKMKLVNEIGKEELMVYSIGTEGSKETPFIMFAAEEVDLIFELLKNEIKTPLETKSFKTLDPNGLAITVDQSGVGIKSLVVSGYIRYKNECLFNKETLTDLMAVLKGM